MPCPVAAGSRAVPLVLVFFCWRENFEALIVSADSRSLEQLCVKVGEALWSAAACCRFDPRACSRPHLPKHRAPASKLASGKAAACCRTPERFAHLHAQLLKAPGICTHNESRKIFAPAEGNQN